MGSRTNWDKVQRERRLNYVPAPRAQAATQRQLDYIRALAHEKGQPMPRMPKTKGGASDHIDRLLALPDVEPHAHSPEPRVSDGPPKPVDDRSALVTELRERFPQLTPMTVHSLIQLFDQIDSAGTAFVCDALIHESDELPVNADALVLCVIRRFLDEIAPITLDAPAMVSR